MTSGKRSSKAMRANQPDLLIAGTGAMACLFAARLAAAGIQPLLLGSWQAGVEAINAGGVRVIGENGEEHAYAVRATTRIPPRGSVANALALVKSWQTERVARQLSKCLAADGIALSLQNGAGNDQELSHYLGAARVSLGATTVGATLIAPGKVKPGGEGVVILERQERLDRFAAWFERAGFEVERHPDVRSVQWGKLVISAAINPLTALLRVRNGELLENNASRSLMQSAAREAAAVAAAQGIALPYSDPAWVVQETARRTAINRSSMLQDILRGAPTEIDAICGAVVRSGERAGVPTPVNRVLWLLVRALAAFSADSSGEGNGAIKKDSLEVIKP